MEHQKGNNADGGNGYNGGGGGVYLSDEGPVVVGKGGVGDVNNGGNDGFPGQFINNRLLIGGNGGGLGGGIGDYSSYRLFCRCFWRWRWGNY
jgi:hypothetical protein